MSMRHLSRVTAACCAAALLIGCAKKKDEPVPVPVTGPPAAAVEPKPAEAQDGNSMAKERGRDEAYMAQLRGFEDERRALNLEAVGLRQQLAARSAVLAQEGGLEAGARPDDATLKNDREYSALEAQSAEVQAGLVAIREQAAAAVQEKMRQQHAAYRASPEYTPPVRKVPEGVLKTEPGRREPVDVP